MAKNKKRAKKNDEARCIAVIHQKGGSGKTTTVINIAGYLAKAGHRVLVVDCDAQGCATSGLGIDRNSVEESVYEVFVGSCNGSPRVCMRDIILETDFKNLHLAPASPELVGAEPYLYGMGSNRIHVLHNALADVRDLYDYIIIDTPPGMGQYLINGIIAAEHVIVTIPPNIFAAEGLETMSMLLDDIKEELQRETDVLGAVVTDCSKENGMVQHIENECERVFGKPLLSIIPHDLKICEAQIEGTPISHFEDGCNAARAYREVADHITRLGTQG